jgi:hypothetical protein
MTTKADPTSPNYMQVILEHQSSVWDDFYYSGGYGMYPTTVFGFVLVLTAVLYCLRPEKRILPVVVTTGVLTMASGIMGTFTGLMVVFTYVKYVAAADAARVAAIGASQAFANIVFALVLVILAGLALLAGMVRQALRRAP